jgi:hypothetical protein
MLSKFLKISLVWLLYGSALATNAQQTHDQPKIVGIPFSLHWKNVPVEFKTTSNMLTIKAGEKTDMFRDPSVTYNTNTAPLLLFTPDADFVLSARIAHDFSQNWMGVHLYSGVMTHTG